MKIRTVPVDQIDRIKGKTKKKGKEKDSDYSSIPGVVVLRNESEYYNWVVYGNKSGPKG